MTLPYQIDPLNKMYNGCSFYCVSPNISYMFSGWIKFKADGSPELSLLLKRDDTAERYTWIVQDAAKWLADNEVICFREQQVALDYLNSL